MPNATDDGQTPVSGLRRAVATVVLAIAGTASSGLVLAVIGWFRPLPATVAAVVASTALILAVRTPTETSVGRGRSRDRSGTSARLAAAAALVVIGLVTVSNVASHGEHLLADRDPGVYVTTGRWLADEGQLLVTTPDDPFSRHETAERTDLGFHPVDDRAGSARAPQFSHLLPVLLAWGHWIGGTTGLLIVPALLGAVALAAVWSFATRMLRPWTATAAIAALAVSPVQVFFSRDAYSEPLTQILLFAGLGLLLDAMSPASPRPTLSRPRLSRPSRALATGAVAGLLLGATFQARIDGVGLLVLIPMWLALALRTAPGSDRREMVRTAAAVAAGAAVSISLGLVDLALRSPSYLERLTPELLALLGTLVVVAMLAVAGVVLADRAPPWWVRARDRWNAPLGATAAVLVGLGAVLGWLVRPAISTVRGDDSDFIAAIQAREGSVVDPTLRYAEHSIEWLSWYLGPVAVALGFVGIALVLWRAGRRFEPSAVTLLVAAGFGVTVLYLWRPSISPDHLWAMRRYLVVTLPLLVLLAGWVIDAATRLAPVPARATVATAVASVVLVLPPALATWPIRDARPHPGLADAVSSICAEVGDDAAIGVIPEDNLGLTAPLALRAWCGVPTSVVPVGIGPDGWQRLAEQWSAEGRDLYAVARSPQALGLVGVAPTVEAEASGPEVEQTLTRRPDETVERTTTLTAGPVGP
ncbi:MAG: hypothetical protein U5K29_08895 [Acidimicrobiales bacterium]|nr:hypothetical protein [Acidimicrobiales bacterium]